MNMLDILNQAGGVGAIARELGIDEGTAQAGAAALLPAVLGGFKGQAQAQPGGLDGLLGILGGMGGGGLLASVLAPAPSNVDAGNSVLGQIFGSKDVSRAVAADAEAKSGVSADLLKRMLPLIAMAVAGYLATQGSGAQAPAPQGAPAATGGFGGMLGGVLGSVLGGGQAHGGGLGGLGSLLDMDRDGNPLDDIIKMAGAATR